MHLIISRLLANRAQNARLMSGKFLVVLPLLSSIWLGMACVLAIARLMPSSGPMAPVWCLALGGALTLPVLVQRAILSGYTAGKLREQPGTRLARLGRWRQIDAVECTTLEHYGAGGVMVMLLAGLLLNIPVRTFEFIAAMPTPKSHAPDWYLVLHGLMLFDLALLSTCYAALVALAVRGVPQFPRLLVGVWLLDLGMQVMIGGVTGAVPHLPPAVHGSLTTLLSGNIQKVLISMAIWLPYLLMSPRVNLTYRHRVPARMMARVN